jgi:hypothetical protein
MINLSKLIMDKQQYFDILESDDSKRTCEIDGKWYYGEIKPLFKLYGNPRAYKYGYDIEYRFFKVSKDNIWVFQECYGLFKSKNQPNGEITQETIRKKHVQAVLDGKIEEFSSLQLLRD